MLSAEEIEANARTYQEQALKVLDERALEVRFNGEWLDMSMEELFALTRTTTVGQLLERDDFSKRYAAREPISVLELLYPLLQGYDSVAVRADVELGGTDQKFNLLLGRNIQRAYQQPEQVIMTLPLLTGTDGERKMSKSYGNHIGVADAPEEIYGRTLSVPDTALRRLVRAAAREPRPTRTLSPGMRSGRWPGRWWSASTTPTRHTRPRRALTACTSATSSPTTSPWCRWELDGRRRCTCRRCSPSLRGLDLGGAAGPRLRGGPGGRRAVAGDVLDVAAGELDGRVLQLGKRRFARVEIVE